MKGGSPSSPEPLLRQRLEAAAEGLVFSSEGDHPFEFFFLPLPDGDDPLAPERFAALLGAPPQEPVGERTLQRFLAHHTDCSDPWDVETQRIRPRYERLMETLRRELRDVRVFRLGEVQVRCYIVGRDVLGNLAGLATTAIET